MDRVSSFLFGSHPDSKVEKKVLIVDSDPKRVAELGAVLRDRGFDPLEATTFEVAKRLWIAEHPAMLIADVRLGQFNGLQLLLRARADRPDLTAIITSSYEDKVLEAETQRFGGLFAVKPVTPEELVGTLLRSLSEASVRDASKQVPERRLFERRRAGIPGFSPERRMTDRRRTIERS